MEKMDKPNRRTFFSKHSDTLWGYFFILPAVIGLIVFYFGPMLFSFFISFNSWDVVRPPKWILFGNYARVFSDELTMKSLGVTLYYTLLAVPATTVVALLTAVLLNTKIKALSFFRTALYIPSIVPMVANVALWMFLYNPAFGLLNYFIGLFGIPPQNWVFAKESVVPSLALMAVWGAGNTIVIYLAGLQGISHELYESVDIDGGNVFHKFFNVTLPMLSPVIFYNVVMGIIGSMQVFTQPYIMTQGGPDNASMFIVLLLYRTAFRNQEMGYASAMSWVLFVLIGIMTLIAFKTSDTWVFIEGEDKNGKKK